MYNQSINCRNLSNEALANDNTLNAFFSFAQFILTSTFFDVHNFYQKKNISVFLDFLSSE